MIATGAKQSERVAQCIRERLAAEGITVRTNCGERWVEVITDDDHPGAQARVDQVAREHQKACSGVMLDGWEYGNVRYGLPQVDWVNPQHRLTPEMAGMLNALAAELCPGETHPGRMARTVRDLFRGIRPEFRARETGGPQPVRCTVCQGVIPDIGQALCNRVLYLRGPEAALGSTEVGQDGGEDGRPQSYRHPDCHQPGRTGK